MNPQETQALLFKAWTDIDNLYETLAKAGVAAHQAGDHAKQAELEAVSHGVYQARKQLLIAFSTANKFATQP